MSDEGRRASDVYSPWKTVAKGLWALIAGFVAFVGPDLANTALVYFSDPANTHQIIAGISDEYKPVASVFLLALMAGVKNWAANRKKG